MKVKVIHILRPKAPERQLCSGARGIIINYTQLWTDFLVSCLCQRSSCVYKEYVRWFYLCLCRLVPEIQVWKHVQLLVLAVLAGLGGLGLLGDWGPLKFAPQQSITKLIIIFITELGIWAYEHVPIQWLNFNLVWSGQFLKLLEWETVVYIWTFKNLIEPISQ